MKTSQPPGDSEVASPSDEPPFLDPRAEVPQHRNRLPHWQQDERTYFVTFHLADSIPRAKMMEWLSERAAWLRWNTPPWSEEQQREYARRFGRTIERWLDAGEGACLLRDPDVAEIVRNAFSHFGGSRCDLHSWVVMPNHVHLLVSLREGQTLDGLMQSWKGFTSRAINRLLGRSGALWQKDYYDRLIRNAEHFWNCANYIRNNPAKARLAENEYPSLRERAGSKNTGRGDFQVAFFDPSPKTSRHGSRLSRS